MAALDLAYAQRSPYGQGMSVQELEAQIARLSPAEMKQFAEWFEEFSADLWDRQIESDVAAGKLDHLGRKADDDFEAGRCTPL